MKMKSKNDDRDPKRTPAAETGKKSRLGPNVGAQNTASVDDLAHTFRTSGLRRALIGIVTEADPNAPIDHARMMAFLRGDPIQPAGAQA